MSMPTVKRRPPQQDVADAMAFPAQDLPSFEKQAEAAANILRLLGNERRLLILCFLMSRKEMTVGEIVSTIGLSQSALSQHLAKLRKDGIVTYRRASQTLYYRIADDRALRLIECLKSIFCEDLK